MNVAFRVDAGAQIGTGHFMRCLSLADRLAASGATIRFVSRSLPAHLQRMLADRACSLVSLGAPSAGDADSTLRHSSWLGTTRAADAEATVAALAGETWDWIVVDHYALDAQWERVMRASARRMLAIDDLADRSHDCDMLLDQNVLADVEPRYDDKVPRQCVKLFGPRFALLRESFRRARAVASPRTGAVARTLIMFGGMDPENWTGLAIEAAAAAGLQCVDVVIGEQHGHRAQIESGCRGRGFGCHVQPPDVAAVMSSADLAIGAVGVTMWEQCCLGVPSLTIALTEDHREIVREAACRGLVYTPPEDDIEVSSLARHITALAQDQPLRERLSRNGMDAVDGCGTSRVVRAMETDGVRVREATRDDAAALLEWRNHESVRAFSRQSDPIAPADHHAWLHGVLRDSNRVLLIGERHGEAVGVVRFDITDSRAEVSTYRVPGSAGSSLGAPLLRAGEEWLRVRKPQVASITAEVLGGNERSHRMLRAAGYQLQGATYEKRLGP